MELKSHEVRGANLGWENIKHTSPNPSAPTIAEAVAKALTESEIKIFEAKLRESGDAVSPSVHQSPAAYVAVAKPH